MGILDSLLVCEEKGHTINDMIFGIWHEHQVRQISLVHSDEDLQREVNDQMLQVDLEFLSLMLHPQIFGNMRQSL